MRITRSAWGERTIQAQAQPDRSSINRVWVSTHVQGELFFRDFSCKTCVEPSIRGSRAAIVNYRRNYRGNLRPC